MPRNPNQLELGGKGDKDRGSQQEWNRLLSSVNCCLECWATSEGPRLGQLPPGQGIGISSAHDRAALVRFHLQGVHGANGCAPMTISRGKRQRARKEATGRSPAIKLPPGPLPPAMQVCSYRCIVSHESPLLEAFSLCILQKHNCLGNSAPIPMRPKVRHGDALACSSGPPAEILRGSQRWRVEWLWLLL